MKIQEKCLPCIVSQTLKVADMVGLQEKDELLKKVFSYLSEVDYQTSSTPELIGDVFDMLKNEIGNEDPYKDTRKKYNTMFVELLPEILETINHSQNPIMMAVKYAIIGNIIDFNPIHNYLLEDIMKYLEKVEQEDLYIDHTNLLIEDLSHAKSVLYLGDNCGEICLDKLLIQKMKEENPSCEIYFATRGKAVVNDSIEEDAYFVGIDEYATIISNGDGSLGTVLHKTTDEFQRIYKEADVILAKGQANYECLSERPENVYFLLMTKCEVIAQDIGVPELKMICMKRHQK